MKRLKRHGLRLGASIALVLIVLVVLAISFQAGRPARAQSETQPQSEAELTPVEHQEVIVVADIWPVNLASEIHKLNDQGKTVTKDDVTIGTDGKMMIWLMDSPGEEE